MQRFGYSRPATVAAAIEAFTAAGANARYVAGGTTLYDLMKLNVERPAHLIDLATVTGLDGITTDGSEIRFGALTLMSAVAVHPGVANDYPVLAESLTKAASQQLRNMASVGGNLLQRTRCVYFRNGASGVSTGNVYPCNKREPGSGCAAIGGIDRGQAVLGQSDACTAVSPGDWPVALVALDARVELEGPQGKRSLAIADLYLTPRSTPHREFALQPGELITAIVVSRTAHASTYHKVRDRESYAFAIASAAAVVDLIDGRVREARIALGGVATVPWRARASEAMLVGQPLDAETALAAGQVAFAKACAGRDNGYKIELGARTIAEALLIAAGRSTR